MVLSIPNTNKKNETYVFMDQGRPWIFQSVGFRFKQFSPFLGHYQSKNERYFFSDKAKMNCFRYIYFETLRSEMVTCVV